MTQELVDLRASILEGRYEDALAIVDELEGMSKKAILRAIKSLVVRMISAIDHTRRFRQYGKRAKEWLECDRMIKNQIVSASQPTTFNAREENNPPLNP